MSGPEGTREKPKTFTEIQSEARDVLEKLRNDVAFGEAQGKSNEEYMKLYGTDTVGDKYRGQIQPHISSLISALEESKQFGADAKLSETFKVTEKIENALRMIREKQNEAKGIISSTQEALDAQRARAAEADIANILEQAA